jgi:TPR repeat protein
MELSARRSLAPFRTAALVAVAIATASCAGFEQDAQLLFDRVGAAISGESADDVYRRGQALQRQGQDAEAVRQYRVAAAEGHGGAAYELGLAYNEGLGVPADRATAVSWFNEAANMGDPRAQFLIGASYFGGIGVEKNHQEGVEYLARAAAQGHPRAQYLLAEAFANGLGVPKDADWAARWYGKAARQGHTDAQFSYGVFLATGRGLPSNRVAGYEWIMLAKKGGHPQAAEVLSALGATMSADDVRRAKALASTFKPGAPGVFADKPTVAYVQYSLQKMGFRPGPVDGLAGRRTKAAVRAYQKRANLPADGQVTPALVESILADRRGA